MRCYRRAEDLWRDADTVWYAVRESLRPWHPEHVPEWAVYQGLQELAETLRLHYEREHPDVWFRLGIVLGRLLRRLRRR